MRGDRYGEPTPQNEDRRAGFQFGYPTNKDKVADTRVISLLQPVQRPIAISQGSINMGKPRGELEKLRQIFELPGDLHGFLCSAGNCVDHSQGRLGPQLIPGKGEALLCLRDGVVEVPRACEQHRVECLGGDKRGIELNRLTDLLERSVVLAEEAVSRGQIGADRTRKRVEVQGASNSTTASSKRPIAVNHSPYTK